MGSITAYYLFINVVVSNKAGYKGFTNGNTTE